MNHFDALLWAVDRIMEASMKVELEPGVWLAEGEGDPARTLDENKAKDFSYMKDVRKALTEARKYRPFHAAVIIMD
jgi:hypothetical protein